MLDYTEIAKLIPRGSRNTAELDHTFAQAIIDAVLQKLERQRTELTEDDLQELLWPHDVKSIPPEEMEKLQWIIRRVRMIRRELPIETRDTPTGIEVYILGIKVPTWPIGAACDAKKLTFCAQLVEAYDKWEAADGKP